jgi:hypothetical protein
VHTTGCSQEKHEAKGFHGTGVHQSNSNKTERKKKTQVRSQAVLAIFFNLFCSLKRSCGRREEEEEVNDVIDILDIKIKGEGNLPNLSSWVSSSSSQNQLRRRHLPRP